MFVKTVPFEKEHVSLFYVLPSKNDVLIAVQNNIFTQCPLLSSVMLILPSDPAKILIEPIFKNPSSHIKEARAFSTLICLAIGDSLGCNTEFDDFCFENPRHNLKNYSDLNKYPSLRAPIGQWTDDTSMALCVADSLLETKGQFNGIDLRYRFLLWWHMGYNNGRKGESSFGLGGNISQSFINFYKNPESEYMEKTETNKNNNGNGSLMRLAPVPIYFHSDETKGLEYAKKQSLTTHTGEEAAECCCLLTHLIIRLINRDQETSHITIFDDLKNTFKSDCHSVMKLAASEKESNVIKDKFNRNDEDRNWNWKSEKFKPSPFREMLNNNYFGSYCMDALALSLHFAYNSKNAKDAILRAVNSGGDSDTVAAITGQIVGAIYGLETEILELYHEGIEKWDDLAIPTTAYKLFHHKGK